MSDECLELKNIKYQTMLLNNNSKVDSSKQNTANLEEFLEKEKTSNTKKSWSKLGRSTKLIKLINFVNNKIPVKCATLDMDATLSETFKQSALFCYKGYRSYQPFNVRWFEQDLFCIHNFVMAMFQQVINSFVFSKRV